MSSPKHSCKLAVVPLQPALTTRAAAATAQSELVATAILNASHGLGSSPYTLGATEGCHQMVVNVLAVL